MAEPPVDVIAASDQLCCPTILEAPLDEAQAQDLAAVLKALADPVRLRLVSIVAASPAGEVCACDLPALVDRTQPTVSHHLSQLVKAGIIDREQRGKWAWFTLRPGRLEAVRGALGRTALGDTAPGGSALGHDAHAS